MVGSVSAPCGNGSKSIPHGRCAETGQNQFRTGSARKRVEINSARKRGATYLLRGIVSAWALCGSHSTGPTSCGIPPISFPHRAETNPNQFRTIPHMRNRNKQKNTQKLRFVVCNRRQSRSPAIIEDEHEGDGKLQRYLNITTSKPPPPPVQSPGVSATGTGGHQGDEKYRPTTLRKKVLRPPKPFRPSALSFPKKSFAPSPPPKKL